MLWERWALQWVRFELSWGGFIEREFVMRYMVRANFIVPKLGEFLRQLNDGTIAGQEPEGKEILASMQRAKITAPGVIEWCETCYCATPLRHERATVYDHYLTNMQTKEIDADLDIPGDFFWEYLRNQASTNKT